MEKEHPMGQDMGNTHPIEEDDGAEIPGINEGVELTDFSQKENDKKAPAEKTESDSK